jgi:purine-binding chemotaxis protein CheW
MPTETADILRERATRLTAPLPNEDHARNELKVVGFTLGNELYAIEPEFIQEVYPLKQVTPLPGTPSFVMGIVNIRRKIVPLIDLKKILEIPSTTAESKIIVLAQKEQQVAIGIDRLVGMLTIFKHSLQPALPSLHGIRQNVLKGITLDQTIVLDGHAILTDKHFIVDSE